MTFKEALQCLYEQTQLPTDESRGEFLKYLYQAAAEVGNLLGVCLECVEFKVEPLECKIDLSKFYDHEILDVTHGQMTIGTFDLHPKNMAHVRAMKNGHQCPTYYAWDCRKPSELHIGPMAREYFDGVIEVVKKFDPNTLDCDDEILDGKGSMYEQLIIERATIKAFISCEEFERATAINELYQVSLSNLTQTIANPSLIERLKSLASADVQARTVLESYT